MDKEQGKEKYKEIMDKLMKNEEFHGYNIVQLTQIGLAIFESHLDGYAEGFRQGIIKHRQSAKEVRDDERGN